MVSMGQSLFVSRFKFHQEALSLKIAQNCHLVKSCMLNIRISSFHRDAVNAPFVTMAAVWSRVGTNRTVWCTIRGSFMGIL